MKNILCTVTLLAITPLFAWANEPAKETTLEGKVGCGHCGYHVTSSCAAAVKTADGKVYVIDNATKEMMDARIKGGNVKVTGVVAEKDGKQTVHASKQELVK